MLEIPNIDPQQEIEIIKVDPNGYLVKQLFDTYLTPWLSDNKVFFWSDSTFKAEKKSIAPFSRLKLWLQKFNLAKTPPIILPSLRNRRNLDGYYQIERNVISDLYLKGKEAQKMKVNFILNECSIIE